MKDATRAVAAWLRERPIADFSAEGTKLAYPPSVNPEYAIGAGLAVLLTVYLVYALLRPEKF